MFPGTAPYTGTEHVSKSTLVIVYIHVVQVPSWFSEEEVERKC